MTDDEFYNFYREWECRKSGGMIDESVLLRWVTSPDLRVLYFAMEYYIENPTRCTEDTYKFITALSVSLIHLNCDNLWLPSQYDVAEVLRNALIKSIRLKDTLFTNVIKNILKILIVSGNKSIADVATLGVLEHTILQKEIAIAFQDWENIPELKSAIDEAVVLASGFNLIIADSQI